MYETRDGQAVDEDLNRKYWIAMDGDPSNIETGFRVF